MSRRKFFPLLIPFALLYCFCSLLSFAADNPKKIVLIAEPITAHPKEAHEYEKNVILLKQLLDTSPDLQGKVRVEAHFHGWPKDPSALDDADTIFLTSDGTDRDEKNHPLYFCDHLQVIERQMKRGCGLVFFHWSTFNPVSVHDRVTEWVGGYFDYETGAAPNRWYSAIQTWEADSKLGTPGHPILRGVKPFTTQEEYYYRIRFRDNDTRLTPIIVTRPPKETNDFTVGWAVERANGGRGFGFTGGHFYANWWNADFRKLILNAIVWTAKLEVPRDGVGSQPFDRFQGLILTGHNHPAHYWRATTAALILALEQDPRAIVHVTENIEDLANPPRSPRREEGDHIIPPPHVGGCNIFYYNLVVLNDGNWAAGRNELTFDPPTELTEGAVFREGSTWTPQESKKRAAVILPAGKSRGAADSKVGQASSLPSASNLPGGGGSGSTAQKGRRDARPTLAAAAHTIATSEPETQQEKDWIDNRWSRTDVGQFLASTLRVPNGTVTRALSIRVGDHDEASVCFDTANLSLRAGWTGDFLKFDAARFGLLNSPKIDGEVQFLAPDGPGWNGATGRFSGFHMQGQRVALEYTLGDTTVRESPWWSKRTPSGLFTRALEVDKHAMS